MTDRYLSEWDWAQEPDVETIPVETLAHDAAVSILIEESSLLALTRRYPEASLRTLTRVADEFDKIITAVLEHEANSSRPRMASDGFEVGDTVVHTRDGRIGFVWSKLPNDSDTYRVQFDSEDDKTYCHATVLRLGRR